MHPTNRGWTRDSGPVFVRRNVDRNLETAIVHFHFNAWAKYRDWQKDRRVPEAAAKHLGKRLFDARWQGKPFILEGGGIDVNGHGTLLTTEECYLSRKIQVRNLGLGRKEFEAALKDNLGVSNVRVAPGRGRRDGLDCPAGRREELSEDQAALNRAPARRGHQAHSQLGQRQLALCLDSAVPWCFDGGLERAQSLPSSS